MKAYTLKKNGDTEELHLFEGEMIDKGCTSCDKSICEKMTKTESSGNAFACKNENDARLACAQAGRQVCGICVSHLYTTYA
jgi:hypothetical protein